MRGFGIWIGVFMAIDLVAAAAIVIAAQLVGFWTIAILFPLGVLGCAVWAIKGSDLLDP